MKGRDAHAAGDRTGAGTPPGAIAAPPAAPAPSGPRGAAIDRDRPIFRPAAVARHRQGERTGELPDRPAPHRLRWLWLGVACLGGLAGLAWTTPVPVLAGCRATVIAWPFRGGDGAEPPPHVAVVRCPPRFQPDLAVGQLVYLDVAAGEAPVVARVAADYPDVLSPADLAARLRWPAAARCDLTAPASVALVVLRPGWRLDPGRLVGASFPARVQVATRTAAALALGRLRAGGG